MQQLSFLPGEMTPGERSLIQRALKTLDRHLHEPGVAFTSTRAAREWLILNWRDWSVKSSGCCI